MAVCGGKTATAQATLDQALRGLAAILLRPPSGSGEPPPMARTRKPQVPPIRIAETSRAETSRTEISRDETSRAETSPEVPPEFREIPGFPLYRVSREGAVRKISGHRGGMTVAHQSRGRETAKVCLIDPSGRRRRVDVANLVRFVFEDPGRSWRRVENPDTGGFLEYSVSRCGCFRNDVTLALMKPSASPHGYMLMRLAGYDRIACYAHRIVALHWLEFPDDWRDCEVHHIDRDPSNNRAENLRWMTRLEHREEEKFASLWHRRLDKKMRVLSLHIDHGVSVPEIAFLLNLSEASARRLIDRDADKYRRGEIARPSLGRRGPEAS